MKDSSIEILVKAYQDIYSIKELSCICGCSTKKIREIWEKVYREQKEYNLARPWIEDILNKRK